MSHYTVLITGADPEEQLQKYSEHNEMEKYEVGVVGKDEKQRMIDYYVKKRIVPEKMTFEKLYEQEGKSWNNNCWKKENGEWHEFSTYNPDSKWDWYLLGGRWSGMIKLKEGKTGDVGAPGVGNNEVGIDSAIKGHERGQMMFFGMVKDEKKDEIWMETEQKIIDSIPDTERISIYDLHI